jgi:hypothetical protein
VRRRQRREREQAAEQHEQRGAKMRESGQGNGLEGNAGIVASRSGWDKAGPNVVRHCALLRRPWPTPRSVVVGFARSARTIPLPSRERCSDVPLQQCSCAGPKPV